MPQTRVRTRKATVKAKGEQKPTVLVVEDSPTQAEALLATLEDGGFDTTLARNGEHALGILHERGFDLLISDIVMPGDVDGYQLCRRVKAGPHHDTPVVLLTSLSDPMDIIHGLEAGADNFLTKPYEPEHLLERLAVLLTTRQARARGRVRAGVTVYFMGRQYTITSEREQILDLLVSTFEDAVRQNRELREREAALARSQKTLAGLYGIAVALNGCTTEAEVAETALEKAMQLPGVRAGWLSLREGETGFRVVATRDLPPALQTPEALQGDCLCHRKLLAGELDQVTNILECERLQQGRGETRGLRYHASVPLWIRNRTVGVLNLVAAERGLFSDEDRTILYGVGNQIATALERARLREHLEQLVDQRTAALRAEMGERQRAETAVRESEERYRDLVNEVNDGFFVTDERGVITFANRALVKIHGRSDLSEMVGHPFTDFIPARSVDQLQATFRAGIEAGPQPTTITAPIARPDGSEGVVEINPVNVVEGGRVIGTRGVVRDITERVRAEQALRLSDSILKQIGNLVLVADSDGLIRYASPSVRTVLGYDPEEVLGDGWWTLSLDQPDERARQKAAAARMARGEVPPPAELYERAVRARDGSLRWILWNDSKGPGDFVIGVGYDVTERKTLEEQFRQAQKMEAVGRLAGGVAHDFNNILTAIIGYSDLLLADPSLAAAARNDLTEVRTAADRAARLTRQLLAFSRKQVLQPQLINLNDVVSEFEAMLHRLLGEDVRLATVLAPDLGTVEADPGQLEQVIMNLAVNARDAMPEGGKLTIETRNVDLDEEYLETHSGVTPGPCVLLAVTDTGHGMDDSVKAHLFEPFFTTKELGHGTGLGLATVHGIVHQSGGHIWVYSEPGHGTTFKIYFPRLQEGPVALQREKAQPELPAGSETVLLVEDDPGVRKLVASTLGKCGYQVLEAEDGAAAAALARSHKGLIHLLLTDVVMPGMSGRSTAESLVQSRPEARVLYMSGYTDEALTRHGILEPGIHLIQKPFTPGALARRVRQVLDAPAARPGGE